MHRNRTAIRRLTAEFLITEWYAQDNWRVDGNFTLDAGVRFYFINRPGAAGDQLARFEPGEYGLGGPLLYLAIPTAQGRRTSTRLPARSCRWLLTSDAWCPGSGDFNNGMQVYDGTPQRESPFRAAPRAQLRLGRDGRRQDGHSGWRRHLLRSLRRRQHPRPDRAATAPQYVHHQLHDNQGPPREPSDSNAEQHPAGITDFTAPVVYNWSLGVRPGHQGFNLTADAAYVRIAGAESAHQPPSQRPAYGYTYRPSSLDRTNVVGGQAQPLPDDLLRPFVGYGTITQREFTGYGDARALHFAVNRRRSADGLAFGAAYTYQIVNKTLGAIDPFVEDNGRGLLHSTGQQVHVLMINYSYEIPGLSRKSDA